MGLVKILMDYVRENCNNVSELSGKCQGISSGVVCGNPEEVPYCFLRSFIKFHGHTGGKIRRFESNLRLLGRSQLSNPSDLPCSNFGAILT